MSTFSNFDPSQSFFIGKLSSTNSLPQFALKTISFPLPKTIFPIRNSPNLLSKSISNFVADPHPNSFKSFPTKTILLFLLLNLLFACLQNIFPRYHDSDSFMKLLSLLFRIIIIIIIIIIYYYYYYYFELLLLYI